MNPDGHVIPLVEDDQGEGMKDPMEVDDLIRHFKEVRKIEDARTQEMIRQSCQKQIDGRNTKRVVLPHRNHR